MDKLAKINEKKCITDSDCTVSFKTLGINPCCWSCGYEAINKKTEEKKLSWKAKNCKEISKGGCPLCKSFFPYDFIASCNFGVCTLTNIFDKCNKIKDKQNREKCYQEFYVEACEDLGLDYVGCKPLLIWDKPPICGPEVTGPRYDLSYCNTSCNINEDCKFTCGCGAINKNETCHDEGIIYDCVGSETKCEDNKCTITGE